MARLSANGTEAYRLTRLSRFRPPEGTAYVILSIRSNLAVLQATQYLVKDRRSTTRWKRAMSATQARERNMTNAEMLRDHFLKMGFEEISTAGDRQRANSNQQANSG